LYFLTIQYTKYYILSNIDEWVNLIILYLRSIWKWIKNIKNPKWAFMNTVMKSPGSKKGWEILDYLRLPSQVLCYTDSGNVKIPDIIKKTKRL
jgi:hypothetical protein